MEMLIGTIAHNEQTLDSGPPADELVDRLYTQGASQTQALMAYFSARAEEPSFD